MTLQKLSILVAAYRVCLDSLVQPVTRAYLRSEKK